MNEKDFDDLQNLKKLLDAGAITQEEFDAKKKQILNGDGSADNQGTIKHTDVSPEQDNTSSPLKSEENAATNNTKSDAGNGVQSFVEMNQTNTKDGKKTKATNGKVPFYKKKWFIIIVVLVILSALANMCDGSDDSSSTSSKKSSVKVTSISAKYTGSREEGVALNSYNTGINVTATYSNKSKKSVSSFTVKKAKTLKAGRKTTVTIQYKGKTCKLTVKCSTPTEKQYKKKCKQIAYNKLARNPNKYDGRYLYIYGQVIQVMENGTGVELRVATKNSGYGWYDDVVYVTYEYKKNDPKFLEDDMVSLWGKSTGTITYESTLGGDITIPSMEAKYKKIG